MSDMPIIYIPNESGGGENRVAAVPDTIRRLGKLGFEPLVQEGAGMAAGFPDAAFIDAGARIATDDAALGQADLVLKVSPPTPDEVGRLKSGAVIVSFLWPLANLDTVRALADRKVTAFAMDRIPRTTRAQSMDALSSQANIAGYKSVLLAADSLHRLFPLLMTAAGTITPARVVILGAGVAGLQAIATARRLGAVVEVSDVRRVAKEQVESLGARFIEVEGAEDLEGSGGYAREASPEFLERQKTEVRKRIVAADVVITTALIPGRPAPRLVTEDMVRDMKPGSVIVDLASEQGGNCELTVPGEVVTRHGVTIIGYRNLPGRVPGHASDMYARNLLNVVQHLFPEGRKSIDFQDEITAGSIQVHDGAVRAPDVAEALSGTGGAK
jgi:NAD(P) transhydrogenase subunit alpha